MTALAGLFVLWAIVIVLIVTPAVRHEPLRGYAIILAGHLTVYSVIAFCVFAGIDAWRRAETEDGVPHWNPTAHAAGLPIDPPRLVLPTNNRRAFDRLVGFIHCQSPDLKHVGDGEPPAYVSPSDFFTGNTELWSLAPRPRPPDWVIDRRNSNASRPGWPGNDAINCRLRALAGRSWYGPVQIRVLDAGGWPLWEVDETYDFGDGLDHPVHTCEPPPHARWPLADAILIATSLRTTDALLRELNLALPAAAEWMEPDAVPDVMSVPGGMRVALVTFL